MVFPSIVADFIAQKNIFSNFCLPQFYPASIDQIDDFQVGYKVHGNTLEDLTGTSTGQFRPNWYVICSGYQSDPFIVDINEISIGLPVYFAWHGAGEWNLITVAENFDVFIEQLDKIYLLEQTSDHIQAELRNIVDIKSEFWQEVYDCYENFEPIDSISDDYTPDPRGRFVIKDFGVNKLKVIHYLKHYMNLSPSEALSLQKQTEVLYDEGYLHVLLPTKIHLESLGAEVVFVEDKPVVHYETENRF